MAARMSSADLVQRKGLGSALWASMKARMSLSSLRVEQWTPRLICLAENALKRRILGEAARHDPPEVLLRQLQPVGGGRHGLFERARRVPLPLHGIAIDV